MVPTNVTEVSDNIAKKKKKKPSKKYGMINALDSL